jgi:uncharacterized lipoprotein YmbA
MRKAKLTVHAVSGLGLTALAGCFSLGRTVPPQMYYVLGATPSAEVEAPPPGDLDGLTIGMRRPRLASYLAIPSLVTRQGAHGIVYSEFHSWGEPLDAGINRTVAVHLEARAAFRSVDVAPWSSREARDFLVQLHVERFEGLMPDEPPGANEGEVHVRATWEIIRPGDGAVLARGSTDWRRPGWQVGDYGELVSSLDAGLDVLSRDLAECLETLVDPRPVGR